LPELEKRETGWALLVPSLDYLSAPLFIGLDREIANAAHKVGLAVVARLPNPSGLTENGLRFWVDEIRSVKAFAVVFEGEEVLGYRTMLSQVAEALRQTYCQVGIVELVSQRGDKALAAMLPERVIRVHSISARELVNFSQSELVDRFVRAVRERNIRLCYIRFPFHLKGEPLDVAREYLSTLRRELEHKGFSIGTPLPLPGVSCPIGLWLLVSLGALTTGIAFLCLFIPLSPRTTVWVDSRGNSLWSGFVVLPPALGRAAVRFGCRNCCPNLGDLVRSKANFAKRSKMAESHNRDCHMLGFDPRLRVH